MQTTQELAEATQQYESEQFRIIMDLVRDKVSKEEKDTIIAAWASTLVRIGHTAWMQGYDSAKAVQL